MLSFIKRTLAKIYATITSPFANLFSRATIDAKTLHELEVILLAADTGVKTTRSILEQLQQAQACNAVANGNELKNQLEQILTTILEKPTAYNPDADIVILVGINGSGKTTLAAKLAHQKVVEGKKVLLVAADTFRAAAAEQLAVWATRTQVAIYQGSPNQDPAAVVFQGCETFKKGFHDTLIIDTAGRLQTKTNLMNE